MTDVRTVLSALIDREPVDADVLAEVLEDPGNRALLVDFVRVDAAIRAEVPVEGTSVAPRLAAARSALSPWLRRAAAVLLLLGAGAGAGMWAERLNSEERPPAATRIVRLQPVVR